MSVMKIFLAIFAAVSVFHVICIALRKEKLRQISKVFAMPPLLVAYMAGAGTLPFFPIPALILGWIGDILLLRIDKKNFFQFGLGAFLLGHLCYIIAFVECFGLFGAGGVSANINLPSLLIFVPPTAVLAMVVFRLIKPTKIMFIPVILYMTVLLVMNLFGFQLFLNNPGLAGLLILSGCFNFMVSDTILAYYTFRKLKILGAILIMVYYLLAQAEIIIGILLIKSPGLFL